MLEIFLAFWYIWIILLLFALYALFKHKLFGHMGESVVRYKLSKLDQNKYRIINNLMVVVNGKSSEIDHVVVSNSGVFVIETKNYRGTITGYEKGKEWTQYINRSKFKFYNPIRQNYGHLLVLKEIFKEYPKIPFIPIVVFTGEAKLKVNAGSSMVISSKDLLRAIENQNKKVLTDKGIDFIYNKLSSLNSNDKIMRKEHIASIKKKK